jgi:hypothetical protein
VRWFAPALFLMTLVLPGAVQAQETTQDTMKLAAPLRTARAALSAGWSSMDAGKVTVAFSDSAVVEFGDQVMRGKQAVSAWVTEVLGGLSSLRMGSPSFTMAPALVTENNTYVVVTSDGSEQPGTVTTVWRRQADNAWKVVRMTVM